MRFGRLLQREARQASRWKYLFVILAPLILAAVGSGLAQPLPPQSEAATPLMSVEVNGSVRFHSEQIAATTGLHPGTNVTREDIQGAADRLAKLGLFAGVQYRFSTVGPGVKLEYQVTDAPEIPVAFDNFPWFTDDELTAALKSAVPLFNGAAPPRGSLLDEISAAIEKALDARGVHVRVSHALSVAGDSTGQIQLFTVENGALDVGSIQFSDALANGDHGIQDRASDLVGKPYSRSAIDIFELEEVRPVYLAHGFLRVQFAQPNSRLMGDAKNASNKVVVLAPINPGAVYTWNGVTWKGNYTVPPEALDDLVKLKTGDVADGMKIEAGLQGVRETYSQRGFLDVKVEATLKFDEAAKRVAYSVSVDEGPQYRMGNLVLTGLSLDGEKRIRGAWKIAPGSVFDKIAYDEFVDTGIKKAFAGLPFRYEKIGRFLQENAQDSKVDVMLDFQ
jgi:outer membrane protein assembly factor BamA